jgi:hypothetical protein
MRRLSAFCPDRNSVADPRTVQHQVSFKSFRKLFIVQSEIQAISLRFEITEPMQAEQEIRITILDRQHQRDIVPESGLEHIAGKN